MTGHEQIRQSLKDFIKPPMQTMLATVQDVDETTNTCTLVDDDGLEYYDVQLRCVLQTGNNSETFYPATGSYALAARIEDTQSWLLISADKYYKKMLSVDTALYQLTAAGHLVQKDGDTLKQVLTLVIQAVQQIAILYGNNPDYVKLAQAMDKVNNILL